jgi:dihydrofolate reductase
VGAEVRDLRERHRQIHTWGSANLLQTLFREALVDQMNLWVCPVVIGQGKQLFPEGTAATRFERLSRRRCIPEG